MMVNMANGDDDRLMKRITIAVTGHRITNGILILLSVLISLFCSTENDSLAA